LPFGKLVLGPVTVLPATYIDACTVAADMREQDRKEIDAVIPLKDTGALCERLLGQSGDMAFVGYLNGSPVAAMGVAMLLPHMGSGWAFGTDRMKRAVPALTRLCLDYITPTLRSRGCHRVEVRSAVEHDLSHRWLEGMGYRLEGIARAYGRDKQDFCTYAKTV
jgi:hypothetical protein